MAFRIGQHVVGGELKNMQRHRVVGWLSFGGERGIHLELLGDFDGDLAGRHIRFDVPDRPADDEGVDDDVSASSLENLPLLQIGAAGEMRLRTLRVPEGPIGELTARARMGELPPIAEHPCLYLEWFSQNGRVVAEIVDPVIEDVVEDEAESTEITPTPLPEPTEGETNPEITGFASDEFGDVQPLDLESFEPDDDDDNPYGLFPEDLDRQLSEASGDPSFDDFAQDAAPQPRDWDEVIPGIEPETKALYEQWDEIYSEQKDELLSTLFDPPMQLPPPDEVTDDETARSLVLQIAARLAMFSVGIDLCAHFTMVRAYRWLIEDVLAEGHVHPELAPTGIVRSYSSWEWCEECDAEFEAEYQQRYGNE